jgi:hypothetical protein
MSRRNNYQGWRAKVPILTLTLLVVTLPAFGALGGDVTTVEADTAHMQGSLRITHTGAYAVHEIQTPTGTVIREYASASGKIFAVAWRGPWLPDMQQLLGDYFQQFADAAQTQANQRLGRKPLQITQPGFVLQQFGHMRSFTGRAYIPEMLPPGVSSEAIQ